MFVERPRIRATSTTDKTRHGQQTPALPRHGKYLAQQPKNKARRRWYGSSEAGQRPRPALRTMAVDAPESGSFRQRRRSQSPSPKRRRRPDHVIVMMATGRPLESHGGGVWNGMNNDGRCVCARSPPVDLQSEESRCLSGLGGERDGEGGRPAMRTRGLFRAALEAPLVDAYQKGEECRLGARSIAAGLCVAWRAWCGSMAVGEQAAVGLAGPKKRPGR
jgi:hypothetical protein